MKEFDSYETNIMSVFVCAIANDDLTGLEDDEIAALDEWLDDQPGDAIFDYGEESYFGDCDILGIMGDVTPVTVNYNLHETET